jgi:hypothetical protein
MGLLHPCWPKNCISALFVLLVYESFCLASKSTASDALQKANALEQNQIQY